MFTGLVSAVGAITQAQEGRDARRFVISTPWRAADIDVGASISHAGVCLTVVERGDAEDRSGGWHAVDVSHETLARSTLGAWAVGTQVNLERSLRAGDELGGHLVAGHVDAVGALVERTADAGSLRLDIQAPAHLAAMIAPKGSIAIDGVSLTVNAVAGGRFGVNIIPHTAEVTTLGGLQAGDAVNLEVDLVARYLARIVEARGASGAHGPHASTDGIGAISATQQGEAS